MNRLIATTALVLLPALPALAAGPAAPAFGLVGERTLVLFDTAAGGVTRTVEIAGEDRILGIDRRPATGALIAVTAAMEIVEVDPATGETTPMSTMDKALPIEDGRPVIVDFNPAADKLRFMSGTTNHRVDVDSGAVTVDGSLAFDGQDMHAGEAPDIVAAAYINSFGKPESTAMYDVDATIVALIQQVSPNDGTLAAIGKFGIEPAATYAFDVQTLADGTNHAYLLADNTLYAVDLGTGEAMPVGAVDGADGMIRDLTVVTTQEAGAS